MKIDLVTDAAKKRNGRRSIKNNGVEFQFSNGESFQLTLSLMSKVKGATKSENMPTSNEVDPTELQDMLSGLRILVEDEGEAVPPVIQCLLKLRFYSEMKKLVVDDNFIDLAHCTGYARLFFGKSNVVLVQHWFAKYIHTTHNNERVYLPSILTALMESQSYVAPKNEGRRKVSFTAQPITTTPTHSSTASPPSDTAVRHAAPQDHHPPRQQSISAAVTPSSHHYNIITPSQHHNTTTTPSHHHNTVTPSQQHHHHRPPAQQQQQHITTRPEVAAVPIHSSTRKLAYTAAAQFHHPPRQQNISAAVTPLLLPDEWQYEIGSDEFWHALNCLLYNHPKNREWLGLKDSEKYRKEGNFTGNRIMTHRVNILDKLSKVIHRNEGKVIAVEALLDQPCNKTLLQRILGVVPVERVLHAVSSAVATDTEERMQSTVDFMMNHLHRNHDKTVLTVRFTQYEIVRWKYSLSLSRKDTDDLLSLLRKKGGICVPSNKLVWLFRDQMPRSPTLKFSNIGREAGKCTVCVSATHGVIDSTDDPDEIEEALGYARFVCPKHLLRDLFKNRPFVKTMDLSLGRKGPWVKRVMVIVSVDGAELHSTSGGVFGFMRIMNQVKFINSPLMQATILLAQTKEDRRFFSVTMPILLSGLEELHQSGVQVLCIDSECAETSTAVEHFHTYPLDYFLVNDMKATKEMLNRQAGSPYRGCPYCNCVTDVAAGTSYERGVDFTTETLIRKSDEWVEQYHHYTVENVLATEHDFEGSKEGRLWSRANDSFAGRYMLPFVSIFQYMIDLLHLQLRLVPVIYLPVLERLNNLCEAGHMCAVQLYIEGMMAIGQGHQALRLCSSDTSSKRKKKKKKKVKKQKTDKKSSESAINERREDNLHDENETDSDSEEEEAFVVAREAPRRSARKKKKTDSGAGDCDVTLSLPKQKPKRKKSKEEPSTDPTSLEKDPQRLDKWLSAGCNSSLDAQALHDALQTESPMKFTGKV